MISWSISTALAANCFDRVIVSTDDSEIADVARSEGADVPFMRPSQLADDQASTQSVVLHALDWLRENGQNCDAICCLYATAPFVLSEDLFAAYQRLLEARPGTVVFAATSFPFPIQRAVRLDQSGYSSMFYPEHFTTRSQDLEEAYHDAGQFYWATPLTWREKLNLFDGGLPLILPRWRVQDIDTEEDWRRAELLHQIIRNQV